MTVNFTWLGSTGGT